MDLLSRFWWLREFIVGKVPKYYFAEFQEAGTGFPQTDEKPKESILNFKFFSMWQPNSLINFTHIRARKLRNEYLHLWYMWNFFFNLYRRTNFFNRISTIFDGFDLPYNANVREPIKYICEEKTQQILRIYFITCEPTEFVGESGDGVLPFGTSVKPLFDKYSDIVFWHSFTSCLRIL